MMELFDSHCHMIDHKFDTDRDDAIARMLEKGVTRYAEIGTDMESSRQVADFAACHKGCYAVVGIHPHEAKTMKDGDLDLLAAWLKEEKVVALGEIGLDYYYDFSPREVQIDVCEKQMELAWQLNVPVAYHVRDAHSDVLRILKRHPARKLGGVIHCFTGTRQDAESYVALGLHIGIGGAILQQPERSESLWEAVKAIPLDRILVETDAPFVLPYCKDVFKPKQVRRTRNTSLVLPAVIGKIAQLKGVSHEEVEIVTARNAIRLFGLPVTQERKG
jgi:TatD DNase family protein